jgi:hypothetical protein
MGYEIIAFGVQGEVVATLETTLEEHKAAHALMGALGVQYEGTDDSGPGDTMEFTLRELGAAQNALIIAINVDAEFTRSLTFLADAVEYMEKHGLEDIEIGFF